MARSDRVLSTACASVARAAALLLLLLSSGCVGYYARWDYLPSREVHLLHVDGAADPAAQVSARLVGVLRPEEHDGVELPRRLHARLEIENRGQGTLLFATKETRVAAAGQEPYSPTEQEALTVAAGEVRKLELHFPLPPEEAVAEEAFDSLELAWRLTLDGRECRGRAHFTRVDPWMYEPYWRDPWWYDPWYGPWCHPWYPNYGMHWHYGWYGWYGRLQAP